MTESGPDLFEADLPPGAPATGPESVAPACQKCGGTKFWDGIPPICRGCGQTYKPPEPVPAPEPEKPDYPVAPDGEMLRPDGNRYSTPVIYADEPPPEPVPRNGGQAAATPFDAPTKDLFGDTVRPSFKNILQARFLQPPFSVLNAREGEWQARKRKWIGMGIKSELGRGEVQGSLASARRIQLSAPGRSPLPAINYAELRDQGVSSEGARGDSRGRAFQEQRLAEEGIEVESWCVSSIFDPVLCELMYRWFSAPGHRILDPFAGGSVRGIVAAAMGRGYVGIELRKEQVDANSLQRDTILGEVDEGRPVWVCGDSREMLTHDLVRGEYDLVFSCPPYGNLEVYSDDPKDISNMTHEQFLECYRDIVIKSCALLRQDRFAAFVVGDFRDDRGILRDFIGDTVQAFKAAGLSYYNDMVLIGSVGSLPVRVTKQFRAGRKVGRSHQMILVFVKGDGKRAAQACGEIDVLGIDAKEAT